MKSSTYFYKPFVILNGLLLAVMLVACYKETAIPVEAFFNAEFIAADESVPVTLKITNLSQGADTYEWTFEGASIATSSEKDPGTITYNTPGTYTLILKASNVDEEIDSFTHEITVFDGIEIDFSTKVLESDFSPVAVQLTNNTEGVGLTYNWVFEGGIPENSNLKNPENVVFENSGEHQISLTVFNGFESFTRDTVITVLPEIEAAFSYETSFEDDDYQAPVTINTTNHSANATNYQWTFSGGTPNITTEENPTVTFNEPGTYTLTLLADNGKKTDTFEKEITILPNTNLRTFSNVHFGTNTAHNNHNTIGAFFSTKTRKSYTANEVDAMNGATIDLVFNGLNSAFNFNQFVSPDIVQNNGFTAIPNANHTKVINSQEICECGGLTVEVFDTMTDDTSLKALIIEETTAGLQPFNRELFPRIVLFETADGRKGAIKIKGFISDENNSYINTDIKIQKEPS